MEQIKDTLQAVLAGLKNKHKNDTEEEKAFKSFRKALTKQERSHIKCISMRNNALAVNVDSSAWLYQLSNKKKELAARAGIQNINFRIGEIE
jgi:predicted nucleic acid-binding Zn ribbon protein